MALACVVAEAQVPPGEDATIAQRRRGVGGEDDRNKAQIAALHDRGRRCTSRGFEESRLIDHGTLD